MLKTAALLSAVRLQIFPTDEAMTQLGFRDQNPYVRGARLLQDAGVAHELILSGVCNSVNDSLGQSRP